MEIVLKRCIIILGLLSSGIVRAQDVQQRLFWLSAQGEFGLKGRSSFIAEIHQRTFFSDIITHQNAMRLHYRVSFKRMDTRLGLSYFRSEPGDAERKPRPVTAEIRPHLDIVIPLNLHDWSIESRWRNELRFFNREEYWSDFIQTNTLRSWRSRFRMQLVSPWKKSFLGTFRGRMGYELFVQKDLQNGEWTIEHQRYLVGINRKFNERYSLELGCIYWRQPILGENNLHRFIVFLNFEFNN